LKGSYAVYKKETLMGEGTGKLCHIHRPEIIDNRGRKCWGDLSIVGNRLCIAIPKNWLGEAAYPVVVDPTIGTTTIGSQNKWVQDVGEPPGELVFELNIPVNRFLVSEAINGLCTANIYVNEDDTIAGGKPVLYSDNGNKPYLRKSVQENSLDLRVSSNKPKGWRQATFSCKETITSGTYIWFGVYCDISWYTRFDYGALCYSGYWDTYNDVQNTYPNNNPFLNDFKLSMYFTYSSAQNYIRTITQGVTIEDKREAKGDYKRTVIQTTSVQSAVKELQAFSRRLIETVRSLDKNTPSFIFTRLIKDIWLFAKLSG
jgi:hypothetical protein